MLFVPCRCLILRLNSNAKLIDEYSWCQDSDDSKKVNPIYYDDGVHPPILMAIKL
jgi:hypothetical protein